MKRKKPKFSRIVQEAMAGVLQRSSRSTLTIVGIALGVASFIAVLGVTSSANGQIGEEFLKTEATQITVTPKGDPFPSGSLFPDNVETSVSTINGVASTGRWWVLNDASLSKLPLALSEPSESQPQILAVSPEYWKLVEPTLQSGRTFDGFLNDQPVALLGKNLAADLGIVDLESQPAIVLNDTKFAVIGIVADTKRSSATLSSVTIPAGYALANFKPPAQLETLIVNTKRGAAAVVSQQLPLAIDAAHPDSFTVTPPPPATVVRDRVNASAQVLFYALAFIGIVVSGVGIANVSLIGVIARTKEIALRRSLGALPRHIAAQFLIEASVRGLLGGSFGTALAILVVATVSLSQEWTAIIDPVTLIAGPVIGVLVGALAGLYPAIKATRIQPIEAFRQ